MSDGAPRAPATGATGAALILAGLGLGLDTALVAGFTLLLLAGGAVAWVELATRRARLVRSPLPRTIVEDQSHRLRIELRGALLRPPGGRVEDPLLKRPIAVGPDWSGLVLEPVRLRGPGRRPLPPARLLVADPLGLWSRELRSAAAEEVVVLPAVEPVHGLNGGGASLGRGAGKLAGDIARLVAVGPGQLEVDGLRPYREGSPASRIHWPAVARSGDMIERRLTGASGSQPLVVLDLRGAPNRIAGDRAVRAAASLCVALANRGGCELLLPGARRTIAIDPDLRAWPAARVRLALADRDAPPSAGIAQRGGARIWVAASPPRAGRPGGVRGPGFLVAPGGERRAASFEVARLLGRPLRRATP